MRNSLVLGVLSGLSLTCVAHAQSGNCDMRVDATQSLALATVTVTSACHRDSSQAVRVSYADDVFVAHFAADDRARVSFVLTSAHDNRIRVRLAEGQAVTRTLEVPEFALIYRVTLIWQAPVRLQLHVVEPGARLGQAGDVNEGAPAALGRMDVAGPSPEPGGSAEQSYVLGDAARDRHGVFSPYLENASLGDVARPPFCGDGPLGSVALRLVTIENGQVTDAAFQSARLACGESVQRRQQRIR